MCVGSDDLPRLAIEGGQPVRPTLLPYGHQLVDESDIRAVVDVLRSDWLTTGPTIAAFEEAVADYVGARYAVAFSSGTAALHASAFAAGLGPEDEAITTPLTFCATANCVLYQGATPVFADITEDTLVVDPSEVSERITPQTRALIPVDYGGQPADLKALIALAEDHGLTVIEDACHALGAEIEGRRVGSLCHMTVFSFHPVKHITTGEGGMVVTEDAELAHKLRLFRSHGVDRNTEVRERMGAWVYQMQALGYNYRLTDLASALGLSQMKKLDDNLARRHEIARRYDAAFAELPEVDVQGEVPSTRSARHLYVILLRLERLRVGRREVFDALRAENIGVNVHYIPVHLHPYYRTRFGYQGGEYPVAEGIYERLLTLPLFPSMTDEDAETVIQGVRKVCESYSRE